MFVLILFTTIVWNVSDSKDNWARYMLVLVKSTSCLFLSDFNET